MFALIAEDSAVNTLLSAVINEASPDEHGVCITGSQDDVLPRTDELCEPVCPIGAGVMPAKEREATAVAILREVPERRHIIPRSPCCAKRHE